MSLGLYFFNFYFLFLLFLFYFCCCCCSVCTPTANSYFWVTQNYQDRFLHSSIHCASHNLTLYVVQETIAIYIYIFQSISFQLSYPKFFFLFFIIPFFPLLLLLFPSYHPLSILSHLPSHHIGHTWFYQPPTQFIFFFSHTHTHIFDTSLNRVLSFFHFPIFTLNFSIFFFGF